MKRFIIHMLQKEIVFVIAFILAAATSFVSVPSVKAIDWMVILLLFDLMLMRLAFEKYHLLDNVAMRLLSRVKSQQSIGFVMILITALLGMFMTNDVALITIVPLTIIMAKRAGFDPFKIIVLETAAANIGSSLTPLGNPQNLYLYSYFKIEVMGFLKITSPFVAIGMVGLLFVNIGNPKKIMEFQIEEVRIKDTKRVLFYCILFIIVILSVLRVVNYLHASAVVIAAVLFLDRDLIREVDYFLLGTFICFFIFIDNVTRMEVIQSFTKVLLDTPVKVFSVSAVLSQFISNVPTAILLSGFSAQYKAILLGVNAGGLGTLIASLANLISYRFYKQAYDKKRYTIYFYKLNFILLIILSFIILLLQVSSF